MTGRAESNLQRARRDRVRARRGRAPAAAAVDGALLTFYNVQYTCTLYIVQMRVTEWPIINI